MRTPQVSVIIPTYKRAHLLPRAILSVLNQTFEDFELLVVDDGSVDDTRQVVARFQEQDLRVGYIWKESSGGAASPRNVGIRRARGEYIAFLDDDDEWMPEKIEKQVALFARSTKENLACVGCSFLNINVNNGRVAAVHAPGRGNILRKLLEECFLLPSVALLKREVFNEVGLFDENTVPAEDQDMWIRLAQKYHFDFVNEPLCKRYIHGENISDTFRYVGLIRRLEYIIEKHRSCYDNHPIAYSKKLRYFGTLSLVGGNMQLARNYFVDSIKSAPYYPRSYINLIVSLLGKRVYTKILGAKRVIAGDVRD